MKKTNKLISILLVLAMLLSMAPIAVFTVGAASAAYNGTPIKPLKINESNYNMLGLTEENWSDYSGYYAIRNASELYGFAALVNGGNRSVNGVLLQDIVVNTSVSASGAVYSWTPIGATEETAFLGTFDGAGHSISGIYYKNADATHVGLFGNIGEYGEYTNAAVKNLILKNSYIYGKQYVGGIVGCLWGENVKVVNCKTDSDVSVVSAHVYGDNLSFYAGGIVGSSYGTTMGYTTYVTNCVSFASVTGTLLEMPENYGLQYEDNYIAAITGSWQSGSNAGEQVTVRDCYYLKNSVKVTAGDRMIYANWGRGGGYQWTDGAGWLPWQDNVYCTILDSASAAHTCVAVATPEIKANCTYGGHSAYSCCLICGSVTSGTKTVTEANDTHFYKGATCTANGVCQLCGDANGPKNPDNHISWIPANCMAPATCEFCSVTKGEKNPDNHTDADKFTYTVNETDESKHDAFYEQCKVFSHTEGHSYDAQGKCTKCTYECAHPSFTDGVCDTCAYKCAHNDIENNKCTACGLEGSVKYINRVWNSATKQVEETVEIAPVSISVVESTTAVTELTDGWYIVNGTVNNRVIKVSGTVHLILADGASLTSMCCTVNEGNSLYIYAQSTGADMGSWKLTNLTENAALGGAEKTAAGRIVINGGFIQASVASGRSGAAIGSGYYGTGGEVIINGGFVKAITEEYGAAIGSGYLGTPVSITVNGGTVYASAEYGAAIGGDRGADAGNVTLNGGNIYATSSRGEKVGTGYQGDPVTVTDGNGNDVTLRTITLSGAAADTPVTKVEGITYGLTDVKTYNTDKLYFYLPADAVITSVTAGGNEYICNGNLTYYTAHSWANNDGICANGCGYECPHENQTGETCEICGASLHTHSFTYSASGDTITAVCENTDGNCPDPEGTLTILAPADLYADGITAKEATVENNLVDTSVAIGDITYSAPYGLPPKDAGTYTASVTVGGATASVQFTLLNYAAKVTDKDGNAVGTYKTFADAITAAQGSEGSTVTLLDDITLTAEQYVYSGKFTLDLNGKKIISENYNTLYILGNADFTINDSSEGGTIESKEQGYCAVYNYGTLTVESGVIKGDGGISNIGTLIFKNGKIESGTYSAIRNSDTAYVYNGILESSNESALYNDTDSTLYVYDGEFSGNSAISNRGSAYIEGGEFTGNAVAALNLHGGTVEVTGGSFTGTDFSNGYYSGTPYGEWTVCYTEGATLILKGGEFPNGFVIDEKTANTFLAEGYYYKDADGKLIDVADDAKVIDGYVKVSKGADLADAVITLDSTEFTYNGGEIKPTVIVTIGGKTLTEGKDYTLTFANNINAGTATVTVTGAGDYTGEATKVFTINKKAVTVTATAPDKVYDGTDAVDMSNVILIFEGIVEGDEVKIVIKNGIFTNSNVGENKRVIIAYTASGEDLNNYKFPEDDMIGIPEADPNLHYAFAVASITAKDISDGFIILGDPLTYNGKEQTQTVEKVIPTGTAPEATFTVSGNKATNVGVYLLTVTGTGNFTGEAKIAYEIAVDMNGVDFDRLHPLNVKATDREKIEYIYNQVDNAFGDYADEAKRNEWDNLKSTCVELLKMIESVENHIESFENDLAKYDIDTVTSDDDAELERFQNSVGKFYNDYYDNLTDEQEKKTSNIFWAIEKLEIRISDVAEEITRITNAVNGYDEATVKYGDYKDILQLIDDIEALTTGKNITDFERAGLEELNAKANLLAAKIRSTADEISRITRAVNAYSIDTVKSSDKADIENLIARIRKLTDGDNITDDERANLNELDSILDALLAKIDETADELARLEAEVGKYDEATVKSSDKTDLEQLKADIKALTDGQNITADERAKLENLDATADALLAKIAETKSEYERVIAAANGYDEATVTSADKDALVQLNDDIYALALTENVTAEEKENLQAAHNKVLGLIDKLTAISDEIKRIIEAVDKYVFESVKSSDKADIQQLIADIKALLDTQNITADERALLEGADETCTKLIEKIDETVAEISRINDATNAYDEATVTSADKADIEKLLADIKALTDGDNITDAEREQLNGNEATLKALLDKIGATADEIERIEKAVNGYDEESVKSTDKADLEQLKADIKALTDATNITEDERTKLGELDATVDSFIKKIDDTAAEIERIDEAVNGYDKETVTSDDIPELGKLIEDIKALTDGDNLTEEEKTALEETEKAIDELVEKLTEVAEEIKRVDEAVKSYDEETVKSSDSEDLAQLKEDIQNLIDSDNTTENEKAALEEMIKDIEGLEDKIEETAKEIERIENAVNGYNEETVKSSDEEAIEQLKEDIQSLIDSGNVTEEEIAGLEETKADADALTDKIDETQAEIDRINDAVAGYDEETVKSTDSEDLAQLKEDIQKLIDSGNLTEEEIAGLEETKADADALTDKITETEEKLEEIKNIENNFNPETVSSDDKAAIEDKIAEIEAVNPDNLTDEQKAEYEEIKAGFESLLDKIEEASKAVTDIAVELEMFDEERVTKFWEDDIEALKAKVDELLADENMGEAEKAKLNEYKAQTEKLIEIINTPKEYFSLRFFYLIWDCLTWKYNGILWLFSKIFGC